MRSDPEIKWPQGFDKLPDFPAFKSFARALWEKQAAVMVGSGFSRACLREPTASAPPLWGDFKARMEIALGYGSGYAPDALRLAQEYQILHGEDGLDRLIRELVPDERWSPGPLHKQLLELPWQDVLTTNWDTLLERTTPETPDRVYSCIRTVQDIAHQVAPRIIKLHGSLPSHKPFIFTEDEFRTYPANFAPFVNLAQQVMLEHELCLIGFSGVDPNFLAWSGWARDTLGASTRRIRLVGSLNLTPPARALLEARNVTPIDLGPLVEKVHSSEKHERALEIFFEALNLAKPPSPFDWVKASGRFSAPSNPPDQEKASRKEVAETWAEDRMSYPGWVVGPVRQTNSLTYNFPTLKKGPETPEAHLRFAAEKIWRHRTACIWIFQNDLEEADQHYESAHSNLSSPERIALCVACATEWRRFQDWGKWSVWMERLQAVSSEEARLAYEYETGQRALLKWDDAAILTAATSLKSEEPIWMMRRAGLLATLYHHREAAELYQAALLRIRQKQVSDPKSAWLISLEGWAAFYHRCSKSALTDDPYSYPEKETDETRMRFLGAKADPWDTISRYDNLTTKRIDRNRKYSEPWSLSFKPGSYRGGSTRVGGDDECPFYGLLELIERTGAPEIISNFDVFSTRLETAYRAITNPDEDDFMAFLARYRGSDKKILDWVLPRTKVAQLSTEAIEQLLEGIQNRVDRLRALNDTRNGNSHLAFLLEVMARIVIRAPSKKALELFLWAISLFEKPVIWWGGYAASNAVMEAAVEAMESADKSSALLAAIGLKTPAEGGAVATERDWPEPIDAFSDQDANDLKISIATSLRIDELISHVEDGQKLDRGRAIRRLHMLFKAEKLSDLQSQALQDAIWKRTDESGWPSDTDLHPWLFLELPGHEQASELFRTTVINAVAEGSVSHDLLMNLRVGLKVGDFVLDEAMLASCISACLDWTPNSMEGRSDIYIALSGDADMNRITAREVGEVLARTLLPMFDPQTIANSDIESRLTTNESYQRLPQLVAVAYQIERLFPEHASFALSLVRVALASRDPKRVYPAYIAMMQYTQDEASESENSEAIVELLMHAIEQRTQPGLSNALHLICDLVADERLSPANQERIVAALPALLEEYRYDQRRLEVPSLADLPLVRKRVHRLASLLRHQHDFLDEIVEELRCDPLPEVRRVKT
ncbi:SIR2 family NAD-dependent protein deacylase [Primorskyibacter flagellatus]|uniref:SIR2-like domain-containing protein n=1 Tax=Primorskyibacter flagellatus TaxID=1387277 RepID=A0A1W2ETU7_9RHOB|nr:SIR2 family protein [Primorskyibacter flagellatus]SMD13055.1 SIR2-like domain-containing protein [Primorskyibacter flagellatus]